MYRERKDPNKPTSKKNKIVTKTINIKDTKNRAIQRVAKKVDNTLARSISIGVTGIGKKKKDISKPKILSKFRKKKSKNTPILRLVELSKYAIDTKKEKRQLRKTKKNKK